jgi:hypothetical protein
MFSYSEKYRIIWRTGKIRSPICFGYGAFFCWIRKTSQKTDNYNGRNGKRLLNKHGIA